MTKDVYYLRVNTGSAAPELNASAARNLLIPPVLQLHKTAVLQNRNDYVRPVFFCHKWSTRFSGVCTSQHDAAASRHMGVSRYYFKSLNLIQIAANLPILPPFTASYETWTAIAVSRQN